MATEGDARLRIGELSRRVDVAPALLRAWEKRYGLLQPSRSDGNFRLYSLADVARVWSMKGNLARGMSAAEAARLALAEGPNRTAELQARGSAHRQAIEDLGSALVHLDESGTQRVLDRAFALHSLEEVLGQIILPCLEQIGDGWERGEVSVAQEHFASTLLRSRLLALAQGWNTGAGPAAVLACPPGELHDIGLICFGLVLWRRGWRIYYIGQDTPIDQLRGLVSVVDPALVVLAAHTTALLISRAEELRSLAEQAPLFIAGAGANPAAAAEIGASALDDDAVAAADAVAAGHQSIG